MNIFFNTKKKKSLELMRFELEKRQIDYNDHSLELYYEFYKTDLSVFYKIIEFYPNYPFTFSFKMYGLPRNAS